MGKRYIAVVDKAIVRGVYAPPVFAIIHFNPRMGRAFSNHKTIHITCRHACRTA